MAVSLRAQKAIEALGGVLEDDGDSVKQWPDGTEPYDKIDHGGWGNFSYRAWKLRNGVIIAWDSDDRQYQIGYK